MGDSLSIIKVLGPTKTMSSIKTTEYLKTKWRNGYPLYSVAHWLKMSKYLVIIFHSSSSFISARVGSSPCASWAWCCFSSFPSASVCVVPVASSTRGRRWRRTWPGRDSWGSSTTNRWRQLQQVNIGRRLYSLIINQIPIFRCFRYRVRGYS